MVEKMGIKELLVLSVKWVIDIYIFIVIAGIVSLFVMGLLSIFGFGIIAMFASFLVFILILICFLYGNYYRYKETPEKTSETDPLQE